MILSPTPKASQILSIFVLDFSPLVLAFEKKRVNTIEIQSHFKGAALIKLSFVFHLAFKKKTTLFYSLKQYDRPFTLHS